MEDALSELDFGSKGYLTKTDFLKWFEDLGDLGELVLVFEKLDSDGDGKISENDFTECFNELRRQRPEFERPSSELGSHRTTLPEMSAEVTKSEKKLSVRSQSQSINEMMDEFESLFSHKSQEQLLELYQQLYEAGQTELLGRFEEVVVSIIKDVRQQQVEKERLEKSYKRDKEEHTRHLRQLEEEMEMQMQKVEGRVRKEKKEKSTDCDSALIPLFCVHG